MFQASSQKMHENDQYTHPEKNTSEDKQMEIYKNRREAKTLVPQSRGQMHRVRRWLWRTLGSRFCTTDSDIENETTNTPMPRQRPRRFSTAREKRKIKQKRINLRTQFSWKPMIEAHQRAEKTSKEMQEILRRRSRKNSQKWRDEGSRDVSVRCRFA
jgi:hypothetical protein